jgi:CTP synthase
VKFKISNFCHVEPSQVINIQDLASIYHVPLEMVRQNIVAILTERLQLSLAAPIRPRKFMLRWRQLANRQENVRKVVNIALVGKYTPLEDAYASVIKVSVSEVTIMLQ